MIVIAIGDAFAIASSNSISGGGGDDDKDNDNTCKSKGIAIWFVHCLDLPETWESIVPSEIPCFKLNKRYFIQCTCAMLNNELVMIEHCDTYTVCSYKFNLHVML